MDVNYFEVLILGLVLSADSFSAALAMGGRSHNVQDSFRFAFSSGGAEALVALLGALAGSQFIARFDSIDHWISFILLIAVALHLGYEGVQELLGDIHSEEEEKFHSLIKILVVSFATSLDAFAVGVGLGVSNRSLVPYIISIGLCAFVTTLMGMAIGKRALNKLGPLFSLIGAFILASLAIKFLLDGLKHVV